MEINETAVEFLFRELWQEPKDKMIWFAILKKALAMEKEQIMDAYCEGVEESEIILLWQERIHAERYYNDTYID